jgi:hypothetical protein
MPLSRITSWLTLIVIGLTTGCAGNGNGLDQNGQPVGASSGGSSVVTADFQSIQDNVFTPICSKCHIGASAPEGLQLDAAHSYNLLVGVPSVEKSSVLRVDPGNPDSSYLVLKIEGASGIDGGQMPLGETPLPQATITAIRAWITNGAMNAQSSSLAATISLEAAKAFAIQTTAPLDKAVIQGPLAQVVVAFTHDVDASLVNDTTVSLEQISAPQSGDDAGISMTQIGASAIAVSAVVAPHNPAVLLITPSVPLGAGRYRLTLRGTGAAALADVNAAVLGSDSSFVFTVEPAQ